MKKTGLFYGTGAVKTSTVAKKIQEAFKKLPISIVPIENARKKDFEAYDNLIVGASTWFDGELPSYWDELLPELSTADLKNKRVAIFGLGDQRNYPENFADGVGILADTFASCGASVVGLTSPDGYQFERSKALKNGKLSGLVIDIENQPEKTDERIKKWVKQVEAEFSSDILLIDDTFIC